MRDRFDCPNDDELIDEQGRAVPCGPIGFMCPRIDVGQALPIELTGALSRCLNGEMMPTQLTGIVTAYLTRHLKRPVSTITA